MFLCLIICLYFFNENLPVKKFTGVYQRIKVILNKIFFGDLQKKLRKF